MHLQYNNNCCDISDPFLRSHLFTPCLVSPLGLQTALLITADNNQQCLLLGNRDPKTADMTIKSKRPAEKLNICKIRIGWKYELYLTKLCPSKSGAW